MNDEQQDRPPWLRNLRPMAEAAALEAMAAVFTGSGVLANQSGTGTVTPVLPRKTTALQQ